MSVSADNFTLECYSSTLEWYIDAIGETPCMTYQRLRQICNSTYTTPSWVINGPADTCDDQQSECCCNSIAWSLRMLCINCEWDWYGTPDPGHSADPYGYYDWRWSGGAQNNGTYCGDGYNQTLPVDVQQIACDKGVRLDQFLYSIFWPDGSWDFNEYETQAESVLGSRTTNQTFICGGTDTGTSNDTVTSAVIGTGMDTPGTTTITQSSTAQAMPTSAGPDVVALVSGSLGGVLGLVLLGATIVVVLRMKKHHLRQSRSNLLGTAGDPGMPESMPVHGLTPFVAWPNELQSPGQLLLQTSTVNALPSATYNKPDEGDPLLLPRVRRQGRVSRPQRNTITTPPQTEVRERDEGMTCMQQTEQPPEYRAVYPGSG
ncbi:hypothetical protein DAEQUDRAFT_153699 [Daedalea quercina L-15889]|uniref:Transmembrane protein n=1 Tax=Daedalea quercina L-15889 TaxID=1314783 RepID=A0A165RML1_9APHY|nr:hypothetical protein DAEQUDRAFT_153699 [Daedalea quercina L-15889]